MREDSCKLWHVLLGEKQQKKSQPPRVEFSNLKWKMLSQKSETPILFIEKYNANVIHTTLQL
jgi:hypothetical protein